jgi:hypothetical protein
MLLACVVTTPLLVPTLTGAAGGGPVAADLIDGIFIVAAALVLWRRRSPFRLPLAVVYALFLIGGLLALPRSVEVGASALGMVQDVYLFVWFLLVVNWLREGAGADPARLSTWWNATSLALAALAILAYLSPFDERTTLFGWPTVTADGRVMATLGNPNLAGDYLVVSFFVLWAAPRPERLPSKALLSVPLLLAIAVTFSNTALLTLVVGSVAAVAVGLLARHPARVPITLGLAAGCIALGIFLVPSLVGAHGASIGARVGPDTLLDRSLGHIDTSAAYRTEHWEAAAYLFGHQIVLGIGPASVVTAFRSLHAPVTGELHSDYVAAFVERGVLGGLATIALMGTAVVWGVRASRNGRLRARGWHPSALAGGAVAIALSAAALEVLHFRHVWLFFGLLLSLSRTERREPALHPVDPV